jgi:hypothetical protein
MRKDTRNYLENSSLFDKLAEKKTSATRRSGSRYTEPRWIILDKPDHEESLVPGLGSTRTATDFR